MPHSCPTQRVSDPALTRNPYSVIPRLRRPGHRRRPRPVAAVDPMSRPEKQPHRLDTEAGADYGIDRSRLDAAVLRRITAMAFRHRLRMAVAVAATLCAAGFQLQIGRAHV